MKKGASPSMKNEYGYLLLSFWALLHHAMLWIGVGYVLEGVTFLLPGRFNTQLSTGQSMW